VRGGEFLERGLRPLSFLTPLSNHGNFSLHLNGSGWRGARVKVTKDQSFKKKLSQVNIEYF